MLGLMLHLDTVISFSDMTGITSLYRSPELVPSVDPDKHQCPPNTKPDEYVFGNIEVVSCPHEDYSDSKPAYLEHQKTCRSLHAWHSCRHPALTTFPLAISAVQPLLFLPIA